MGIRLCVDVDLLDEPMSGFLLVASNKEPRWQEVMYEKRDFYCTKCFKQGHTAVVCRAREQVKAQVARKEGPKPQKNEGEEKMWKEVRRKKNLQIMGDKGVEIEKEVVF